jgi:DNA-binding NtrC family response regulator
VSPLRERPDDLPELIEHFVRIHDRHTPPRAIDRDFIDAVSRLELPGNVRELRNLIAMSLALKVDAGPLNLKDLPAHVWKELLRVGEAPSPAATSNLSVDEESGASVRSIAIRVGDRHQWNLGKCLCEFEREIVIAAMIRARNNQSQAARLLGLTSRSIYNKLRKHKLLGKSLS